MSHQRRDARAIRRIGAMTSQEAAIQLQGIQANLIHDIDTLELVAQDMPVESAEALLLTNYIVPHLRYLVIDDGEYSQLLPNLSDAITGVKIGKPR